MTKKELKILLVCIGLACIGFIYDNACDYVMDVMDDNKKEVQEQNEYKEMVMRTIEEDIYKACGLDSYCGDLFIEV